MSSQSGEARLPISLFLIVVGIILIGTAGIIWVLSSQLSQQGVQIVPTAVPTVRLEETAVDSPPSNSDTVALLPETPNEADATPFPAHFVNALEAAQPNQGQPVRVVIPQISLDAPVNPIGLLAIEHEGKTVLQWQVPSDFIAGWHNSSARLGEMGNTVLNGHHNIFGEVFRDLDELEAGAEITLFDPQQSYSYTVSEVLILEEQGQPLDVRLENAKLINETDDERLTLVTCWPYTDNTHRLIVIAHPTG